jgi:hypothetical protein
MIFPEQQKPKDWCRLYLLYASASPKVIILRRGPTKWVQQIVWNTETDMFTYGQWFRGGIKTYDCDVSPSGDYLIYFAQKYGVKDPAYQTFTAVSKTPTFTAMTLWSLGDSWAGGGIFIDDKTLWLNHPEGKREAHQDHTNTLFTLVPFPQDHSLQKIPIERYRILREGWVLTEKPEPDPKRITIRTREELISMCRDSNELPTYLQEENDPSRKWHQIETFYRTETWEKKALHSTYTLVYKPRIIISRMVGGYGSFEYYGSPESVEFYIRHDASGKEDLLVDVAQANFDHRGRLIMARYGALLGCDLQHESLQAHVLVDLNDQKPPAR